MLKRSVMALTLAGLLATPAYADLTINGFASIKAGMTLGSDEQLYGYSDELDFKNESLFAVQVMSDLGEKLSVTAQLMGRGREDFAAGDRGGEDRHLQRGDSNVVLPKSGKSHLGIIQVERVNAGGGQHRNINFFAKAK